MVKAGLPGYIPFIPLAPVIGAFVLLVFRKPFARIAGIFASSMIGVSLILTLMVVGDLMGRKGEERVLAGPAYEWISAGGLQLNLEFKVDPLTVIMLLVVTGVGSLIHIYSIGYMEHDPRKATYFGYLNLFAGSMLLLVLANNFLVLYVGWELVGLCSYLLISFWYFKPAAAAAGKKAFLVNRIGDMGFLIGIFLIYSQFGTLDFDEVFQRAGDAPLVGGIATAIPLLLFVGAVGKSAQIPLHVWLPDAMEGPTPVSALIHAATMVTAGVYMVARTHVLFEASHAAALTVASIGVATALFAATIACVQNDIKRVLAYSTVSQLGFMFLAVGVGALTRSPAAYAAGIFHLVTHAFFKALMFLGAGSVMHALKDETDMRKMGGLIKALPRTGWTFVIGWLAILGIPPLSGFFSKDAILVSVYEEGWFLLWAVATIAAFLTAFYMSRQVFLVFFGKSRVAEDVSPHESPAVMTGPLVALAGLAAIAGAWLGATHSGLIFKTLEGVFGHAPEDSAAELLFEIPEVGLVVIAVVLSLLGMFSAWRLYLAAGAQRLRKTLANRWEGALTILRNNYYVDSLYGALFVWPGKTAANTLAYGFDLRIIDGAVNGVAQLVGQTASGARKVQTGLVRRYVMAMLGGVVALLALFLVRFR